VVGSGTEGGGLRFDFGWDAPTIVGVQIARRLNIVVWNVTACPFMPDRTGPEPPSRSTSAEAMTEGAKCSSATTASPSSSTATTPAGKGGGHFMPSLQNYVDTGVGNPRGSAADKARHVYRQTRRRLIALGFAATAAVS
jgi:hypothetical protein